ncbi:unnamed protein product [Gadus morhua 'NCC']
MSGSPSDACDLTLDPNTAYRRLSLSEDNRKVTEVGVDQSYPDHPERFDSWAQVLGREALTGRCYWERHQESEPWVLTSIRVPTGPPAPPGERALGPDVHQSTNGPSWVLTSIRVPTGPPAPPGERALRSERSGTFTDCLCDDGGI